MIILTEESDLKLIDKIDKTNLKYWTYNIKNSIKKKGDKNKNLIFFQVIWFFYILIIVLSGFIFPKYHPSQTFKSLSPEKIFDKNEEPLIYSHVTDIHSKKVMPNIIKKIRQLFKKLKNYKIGFNRFTGDLVHIKN